MIGIVVFYGLIMNKEKTPVKTLAVTESQLSHSDLEKYLLLPSGISAIKAKSVAKDIIEAQGQLYPEQPLPYNFALRMVYWSNGLPQIKDVSQGLDILVKENIGVELSQLKLFIREGKVVGFKGATSSGYVHEARNYNGLSREQFISSIIPFLKSGIKSDQKSKRFLLTIKQAIIFIENECEFNRRFYSLPKGKAIKDITKLAEISIDVNKLMYSTCEDLFTLRYALASCYNTKDTIDAVLKKSVIKLKKVTGKKTLNLDYESDYLKLNNFLDLETQFCGLCFASDSKSKKLIQSLIENYCGW